MLTWLRNTFVNAGRYKEHPEAVIISCFYNPQNSAPRYEAFKKWYDSIKHLNHLIVECLIDGAESQLPKSSSIIQVKSDSTLWHKESLLNLAVSKLPAKYKYVFWVDADVIFTNLNWLTEGVKELEHGAQILQPFEYCFHLEKGESEPGFDTDEAISDLINDNKRNPRMWRSFSANFVDLEEDCESTDYNTHGHVGFAWGATRELLEQVPLYDKALVGGADHIIAHAAANQIPSNCIDKSFTEDLDAVYAWSRKFAREVDGGIAYVPGNLYHLWHGDIKSREYLKRVQEFTPTTKQITEKDENGLYVAKDGKDQYVKEYFQKREKGSPTPNTTKVVRVNTTQHHHHNHGGGYGYGSTHHYHWNMGGGGGGGYTGRNNSNINGSYVPENKSVTLPSEDTTNINPELPSEDMSNATENFS